MVSVRVKNGISKFSFSFKYSKSGKKCPGVIISAGNVLDVCEWV